MTISTLYRKIKYFIFRHFHEKCALTAYASYLLGYNVDIKHPKTFNEKLTWLKLNDRNEEYHKLVDKYEVKRIVSAKIGAEHVVPCLGVWDNFDEIDFSKMPTQFVIKSTHYGAPVIVKDKSKMDIPSIRGIIKSQATKSGYGANYEWVYKDVRPRVLIDKYLEDNSGNSVLQDYKFWCFNGAPLYMYMTVKDQNIYENFYDMDFNAVDINHGFPRHSPEFKKPGPFDKMKEFAKILSKGIPFVRVDFFVVEGNIYFGEMTFYDWAGTHPFINYEQDLFLGSLIDLPIK